MSFLKKIFGKSASSQKTTNPEIETEKSFAEISSRIFPYFKQFLPSEEATHPLPVDLGKIDESKTYEVPDLKIVFRNICEDLNCLYAIDTGTSFKIVQEKHINEWGIDRERLHELAVENFRSLIVQRMTAKGDSNGIMFFVDGNLEAGLVLIDDIWQQLEDQIGEQIVITVPSRDVIMATGKSNRAMIDKFKQTSKDILQNGDHPLSSNLFIRDAAGWNFFEQILP